MAAIERWLLYRGVCRRYGPACIGTWTAIERCVGLERHNFIIMTFIDYDNWSHMA